jgi:hypothetical protein
MTRADVPSTMSSATIRIPEAEPWLIRRPAQPCLAMPESHQVSGLSAWRTRRSPRVWAPCRNVNGRSWACHAHARNTFWLIKPLRIPEPPAIRSLPGRSPHYELALMLRITSTTMAI